MRCKIVAAVILAAFVALQTGSARQSSSSAPPAPTTPREKEELQARIFMARKQYAEAAGLYAKLSAEYPKNVSYLNAIGIAKQQQNDIKEAEKYYERATKVDKTFATGFSNLGTVWYAQKQYKKAIRYYQKAISIDPRTAGFYTNLGFAYFAQKQYPQALGAFQKAMEIDPGIFQQNDRNGQVVSDQSVSDRGLFDFMLAKSFAQKNDAANCAIYLRRAFDEGYQEMDKAGTDHAFDAVRSDPDVKRVLDLLPQQKSVAAAPSGH
jgi:tetratricopeptide (TPR) repeat protein